TLEVDVSVVPSVCGVSREELTGQRHRSAPRSPLRLLYLGRLAQWKGTHLAVEVLATLRSSGQAAELTIAGGAWFGDAEYGRALREDVMRAEVAEHVRFVGHVHPVGRLLDEHDLLL